jgi:hypothetical protein
MDEKVVANCVVNALQATAEALEAIARDLPPDRRAAVEERTKWIRQAKSGIMVEMM